MNREETKRAAEVMLHYANGGEVQCRVRSERTWTDLGIGKLTPSWAWSQSEYRIKPQPVEVTAWAVVFETHRGMMCARSKGEAEKLQADYGGHIVELKGTYTCEQ